MIDKKVRDSKRKMLCTEDRVRCSATAIYGRLDTAVA